MERGSRKRSSSAGSEKMEKGGGRYEQMEGHCSTGQSPQWAVMPIEEEEEEEKRKKRKEEEKEGEEKEEKKKGGGGEGVHTLMSGLLSLSRMTLYDLTDNQMWIHYRLPE